MKKKIYLLELVEFYYYDTKDDENVEDRWIIGYFLTLSKLVEAISKCFDLKKETERIVVTSFDIKLNYNQKFVYVLSYEYSYLLNNNYIDYSYVFDPQTNINKCKIMMNELKKQKKYAHNKRKLYDECSKQGFYFTKYRLDFNYRNSQ